MRYSSAVACWLEVCAGVADSGCGTLAQADDRARAHIGEDLADEIFRDQHGKAFRTGDQLVGGGIGVLVISLDARVIGGQFGEDATKERVAAQHVAFVHARDSADPVGRGTPREA